MERQKVMNTHAISSLTFGIGSIVIPFFGFVLGLIGFFIGRKSLNQIDQSHEDGRGLAIAGIVCSSIGIMIQILIILAVFTFFAWTVEVDVAPFRP